ncbi:hypothetical protein ABT352_12925 [Streptosporangium sp. NPDC000563]|uniref:hypothetical protein n=1 Tax=Streptosporangium sp. NPDC000563 TaxID=3154366 RepID=UPI0033259DB8
MNQYQGRESCALPATGAASPPRARAARPADRAIHTGRVDIAVSGPVGGETS